MATTIAKGEVVLRFTMLSFTLVAKAFHTVAANVVVAYSRLTKFCFTARSNV